MSAPGLKIPPRPHPPLRLGISLCLLGEGVRYDGSHERSSLCHDALEGLFEYEGICPEVAIGMGVPRAPIQLVGDPARPRARGVEDASVDVTDALANYGRRVAARIGDFAGYVLMNGSPSCGMHAVRVHVAVRGPLGRPVERRPGARHERVGEGSGIYAREIMAADPCLPVVESVRLEDAVVRESFVTRTFAYAHWKLLGPQRESVGAILEFHSRYKYLLLAHSAAEYRRLGRLLANPPAVGDGELASRYIHGLMSGLSRAATRDSHADALVHLVTSLEPGLNSASRRELTEAIEAHARGEVPRAAVLTLLARHQGSGPNDFVSGQVYLEPHPTLPHGRNML